jgi:hypothetical protein
MCGDDSPFLEAEAMDPMASAIPISSAAESLGLPL